MTLQTIAPISLSDLQTEFGGSSTDGININEYYRGGTYVNAGTIAGSGSKRTDPLNASTVLETPSQIPTTGQVQLSQFLGTSATIVGNSGIIDLSTVDATNNPSFPTLTDFYDVPLPDGVDLVRMFIIGGGGGGGGCDTPGDGGNGGAGSTLSGTFSTAPFGASLIGRSLRVFIGKGGAAGRNNAEESTLSDPPAIGGHGWPMNQIQSPGSWSAFMNNYGVQWEQASSDYQMYTFAPYSTSRSLYVSTAGTYTLQFQSDNGVAIWIDGNTFASSWPSALAGSNDQAYDNNGSYSLSSPLTKSINLSVGWHQFTFRYANTGGIGAYAVRILDPNSSEFWTTRYDTSHIFGYPVGGNGGIAATNGTSGQGGAGGSATAVWLMTNNKTVGWPIAVAGGGGGGGGAGRNNLSNESIHGNWMTQGWTSFSYMDLKPGGEGEYASKRNNGVSGQIINDGGGGGGGGGGLTSSDRQYVPSRYFPISGLGGRTARGSMADAANLDCSADGGESGRSGITYQTTWYNDFNHCVSTGRNPVIPTAPRSEWATIGSTHGIGGLGQTTISGSNITAGAGSNGAAFFDWGTATAAVPANSVSRPAVRAGLMAYDGPPQYGSQDIAPGSQRTVTINTFTGSTSFVVDAWGGGGNPGTSISDATHPVNYFYAWSNVSGSASFSAPSSPQTTVYPQGLPDGSSIIGPVSGVIRVTVSDGRGGVGTADFTWNAVYVDPNPNVGG